MTTTNFPTATAAEWTQAYRIILRAVSRTGLPGRDGQTMHCADAAAEVAQAATSHILTKTYRVQPESLRHAACMVAKAGRLYGWHQYRQGENAARRRSQKGDESTAAAQEHAVAVAVSRSVTPSPADMAEQAERRGVSVHRVHEAYGVGGYAMAEPNTTPSVYAAGPATLPPVEGRRLWKLETDPNAERTLQATHPASNPVQWRAVDADYRQALAEYYAGR